MTGTDPQRPTNSARRRTAPQPSATTISWRSEDKPGLADRPHREVTCAAKASHPGPRPRFPGGAAALELARPAGRATLLLIELKLHGT